MNIVERANTDFEKACKENEVKPTNMKADWFMIGHVKGQRTMLDVVKEILHLRFGLDESMIEQIEKEVLE